tara:strand:+ start:3697 stop:3897 length:201 start_codon:yes stop_codon:yes gene_type:complete
MSEQWKNLSVEDRKTLAEKKIQKFLTSMKDDLGAAIVPQVTLLGTNIQSSFQVVLLTEEDTSTKET